MVRIKSGKDSASQSGERENGFLPLDSVVIERTRWWRNNERFAVLLLRSEYFFLTHNEQRIKRKRKRKEEEKGRKDCIGIDTTNSQALVST
jgi:hypothetical protein